jgi:hypothetical protein
MQWGPTRTRACRYECDVYHHDFVLRYEIGRRVELKMSVRFAIILSHPKE